MSRFLFCMASITSYEKISPKELRGRVENAFFLLENAQKSLFKNDQQDSLEIDLLLLATPNE